MQLTKYFKVPWHGQHDISIKQLSLITGDSVPLTYGRWHILLGILYDADGAYDITSEVNRKLLAIELDLQMAEWVQEQPVDHSDNITGWVWALFSCGLIEPSIARGMIINSGVVSGVEYVKKMREMASKGGKKSKRSISG